MRTSRPVRRVSLRSMTAGLAVVSLALLAGCSDDADDVATDSGTDTNTETTAPAGDFTAFCDSVVEVDKATLPLQGPPGEEPDPAVIEAARAAMNAAGEAAPDEIADATDRLVAGGLELLETGETPEGFDEASNELYDWVGGNCGFTVVDVTAKDYEYAGMPSDVEAGPAVLKLSNEGKELHEMMYLKVNEGVTETTEEILALPEEEAMTKVEMAGGVFAAPGQTGQASVDLEPGQYIVVCFIPVGLTPEAAAAGETTGEFPDGPPHFTQGMVHDITVT